MKDRAEFERELALLNTEGLKSHPLRLEYEKKVRALSDLRDNLSTEGVETELLARRLHEERRSLGKIYKDAALPLFREYILYATEKKYGDPLGPKYEDLRKRKTAAEIIESASRPIADLDTRLTADGFRIWFERSDEQVLAEIAKKMIIFSDGNTHDINHLLKVHSYARTIGILEGLDAETQLILEVSAFLHDIACPLCRVKYGNTNGKYQEIEGAPMARDFLAGSGLTEAEKDRVAFLVGHHHTPSGVDGIDYQILLEADYLVNADESSYSEENIRHSLEVMFRTASGTELLRNIYGI